MKLEFQHLPEPRHAVRKQDAVEAVAHIGVLVANVQEPACRRILCHARRLQQHLVQRRVGSAGHVLDVLIRDLVGTGAAREVSDGIALLIERPRLLDHAFGRLRRDLLRRRRGRRGNRLRDARCRSGFGRYDRLWCNDATRRDRLLPLCGFGRGGRFSGRLGSLLFRGLDFDFGQFLLRQGPITGSDEGEHGAAQQQASSNTGTHLHLQTHVGRANEASGR